VNRRFKLKEMQAAIDLDELIYLIIVIDSTATKSLEY
jgi:hypothetical protein